MFTVKSLRFSGCLKIPIMKYWKKQEILRRQEGQGLEIEYLVVGMREFFLFFKSIFCLELREAFVFSR